MNNELALLIISFLIWLSVGTPFYLIWILSKEYMGSNKEQTILMNIIGGPFLLVCLVFIIILVLSLIILFLFFWIFIFPVVYIYNLLDY